MMRILWSHRSPLPLQVQKTFGRKVKGNLKIRFSSMSSKIINTVNMCQLLQFGIKMRNCVSVLKDIKFQISFVIELERNVNSFRVI